MIGSWKAEGRAGLGGRAPFTVPVTVLTPATDGRKDPPTARMRRMIDESIGGDK